MFPDKLDLVSQELVKLAKDNGSSDNISIVVVFLKPIEELAAMELPIDTKDLDTISQNGTLRLTSSDKQRGPFGFIKLNMSRFTLKFERYPSLNK